MQEEKPIGEQKKELRRIIRKTIDALPIGELHREGEKAARLLRANELWRSAEEILIFLSGAREIDTVPLLEGAFEDGKRVFAPKMEGENIVFYRISRNEEWETGPFDIQEPRNTEKREKFSGEAGLSLVITPGAAFDLTGNRLGYGKGFYDRFFESAREQHRRRRIMYIGLCGEFQIIDHTPTEAWDTSMDALCTGREFRIFAGDLNGKN